MDNVTHALAGALLGSVAASRVQAKRARNAPHDDASYATFGAIAMTVGIVAAELPDIDLVYAGQVLGMGNLGYLLHHRGYTHTVLFAVLGAMTLVALVLWRRARARNAEERATLVVLALCGTLSHLVLDYGNNYGVHPFWPVRNAWYYGDAVFIVEPWFWIVSIPPLLFVVRNRIGRGALVLAQIAILGAVWAVPMVSRTVAIALSAACALWWVLMRRTSVSRRIPAALVAWCAVEALFFAASAMARRNVMGTERPGNVFDVALTPAIGNPFCFSAQLMELDGDAYTVTNAEVASVPAWVRASQCASAATSPDTGDRARAIVRHAVAFRGSRAALQQLAKSNCEIAAALRFVRVPVWEARATGDATLSDARFGAGGGFAAVTTHTPPLSCPAHVPNWTPPRVDLLHGTP